MSFSIRPRVRGNPALRFVDRWAGIPAMVMLGLLRRRSPRPPHSIERIGLMKTAGIGDGLLMAGPLADVRAAFPTAEIFVVTGEENRLAGQLIGAGARQIVVSPLAIQKSVKALRAARLDVLFDFGPWVRFDAMMAALSGARFIAGFRSPRQYRHYAYDVAVEHRNDCHEVDNLRRVVATIGVEGRAEPRFARPGGLDGARIPSGPFAVFHCWAGGFRHEIKEWPVARWLEIGKPLSDRGWTIVLSGSPADVPKSAELAAAMTAYGIRVADMAGKLSLPELADLCCEAKVVVSVNTGVMHLAAEAGASVVSLEGPTSALRWGPRGPRARSVETAFERCGYLQLGWEYDGNRLDCMAGIRTEDVLDAIDSLTQ